MFHNADIQVDLAHRLQAPMLISMVVVVAVNIYQFGEQVAVAVNIYQSVEQVVVVTDDVQ
jgi:hypothetical protein